MTTDRESVLPEQVLADLDDRAVQLVAITPGDGDAGDVARLTAALDRRQLIALAISCAAMVDPSRPVSELLAWMDPSPPVWESTTADGRVQTWTEPDLRRAHAAYARGVRTPYVAEGERVYQRLSKRARATAGTGAAA